MQVFANFQTKSPPPRRCPNLQNAWLYQVMWQREIKVAGGIKVVHQLTLKQIISGLSGWAQCNQKGHEKCKSGSEDGTRGIASMRRAQSSIAGCEDGGRACESTDVAGLQKLERQETLEPPGRMQLCQSLDVSPVLWSEFTC